MRSAAFNGAVVLGGLAGCRGFVIDSPVIGHPSAPGRRFVASLGVAQPSSLAVSQQGSSALPLLSAVALSVGVIAAIASSVRGRRGSPKAKVRRCAVVTEEKRFPVLSKRIHATGSYPGLPPSVHPGVVTGKALDDLYEWAKKNSFAIPAVNCVSSCSINACLEAARQMDAPIIIQFSSGGSQFYAGKGLDNTKFHAAIAGAVSGAYHVRALAEQYGVPVVLHTDHCGRDLLPWIEGLLEANERFFASYQEPLFSSHMIDLSEEPIEENIATCKEYLERMAKINVSLEMELGITGGEEDGVNNEDVAQEDLYSKPEEIWQVYEELSKVPNGSFTIAAAFGNVHGVYQPGNVKLKPTILSDAQKFISEKLKGEAGDSPVNFVFHGGSGSDLNDIKEAIGYGCIKMNIDTDVQWAFWSGIKGFEAKYKDYLQTQIGNPEGNSKPNKKYYDPRACLRSAEESTVSRLGKCFEDLNCVKRLGLPAPGKPNNVLGPRRGALPA